MSWTKAAPALWDPSPLIPIAFVTPVPSMLLYPVTHNAPDPINVRCVSRGSVSSSRQHPVPCRRACTQFWVPCTVESCWGRQGQAGKGALGPRAAAGRKQSSSLVPITVYSWDAHKNHWGRQCRRAKVKGSALLLPAGEKALSELSMPAPALHGGAHVCCCLCSKCSSGQGQHHLPQGSTGLGWGLCRQ